LKEKKLYVLVRSDLPRKYQAVQAGHAVGEYLLHVPNPNWYNGTLIYLSVRDEKALQRWVEVLNSKGLKCVCFKEPDLDNEITALSVVSDGKLFSKLKLW
jgi:hypothetical protein